VKYLLDTNICIFLVKKKFPLMERRVQQEEPFSLAVSAISVAELEFGVAKSLYPEKNRLVLLQFLSLFEILPFSVDDCRAYGEVRAFLQARGILIGPYDLQIAAQCLTRNLCLVTNNCKEFVRVPGLRFEDWTGNLPS